MGQCYIHEDRESAAVCAQCGMEICEQCIVQVGDETLCPECAAERESEPRKGFFAERLKILPVEWPAIFLLPAAVVLMLIAAAVMIVEYGGTPDLISIVYMFGLPAIYAVAAFFYVYGRITNRMAFYYNAAVFASACAAASMLFLVMYSLAQGEPGLIFSSFGGDFLLEFALVFIGIGVALAATDEKPSNGSIALCSAGIVFIIGALIYIVAVSSASTGGIDLSAVSNAMLSTTSIRVIFMLLAAASMSLPVKMRYIAGVSLLFASLIIPVTVEVSTNFYFPRAVELFVIIRMLASLLIPALNSVYLKGAAQNEEPLEEPAE